MKSLGALLATCGFVCLVMSAIGFFYISRYGLSANLIDTALSVENMIGVTQLKGTGEKVVHWLMQYRMTTLIGGLALAVIGIVMQTAGKKR